MRVIKLIKLSTQQLVMIFCIHNLMELDFDELEKSVIQNKEINFKIKLGSTFDMKNKYDIKDIQNSFGQLRFRKIENNY